MHAEIRLTDDAAWVVCPRCGLAENLHDDVPAAEDVAAGHEHGAIRAESALQSA